MPRWFLSILVFFVLSLEVSALTEERRAQGRILLEKYTAEVDSDERLELLDELLDLDPAIGGVMWKRISGEWKQAWQDYRKQYKEACLAFAKRKASGENRRRSKKLVAQILALSATGEPSKEAIREKGDPALEELRSLSRLRLEEVLVTSPSLGKARKRIYQLALEYNACIEELVLIDETSLDTEVTIEGFEKSCATRALAQDRALLRVEKQNAKHVGAVPPEAIEGIQDLNELRSLLGLRALLLDPKLCQAALGHSKDMVEHGFFAHESPVEGKRTISDRAKKEGTSTSGENISFGVDTPQAANRGWWHSPPHHANMLNGSHKRIGLGHHKGYWTQMFGR